MGNNVYGEHNQVKRVGVRPGITGEPINVSGRQAVVGTTILYTVAVGKLLLLFNSWGAFQHGTLAGLNQIFGVYTAVPALDYGIGRSDNIGAIVSFSISHSRHIPIEIPAGYSVRLVIVGGGVLNGGIEGILINV